MEKDTKYFIGVVIILLICMAVNINKNSITGMVVDNIALKSKTATCIAGSEWSSTWSSFPCTNAIDGISNTDWATYKNTNPWIRINLGGAKKINKIILKQRRTSGERISSGVLIFNEDIKDSIIVNFKDGEDATVIFPVKEFVNKIRFEITGFGSSGNAGLSAFEVYYDDTIKYCSDGTPYGYCSSDKPKKCISGNLKDACGECGCPSGTTCKDGKCISTTTCIDSDGGLNYTVKGQIKINGKDSNYDYCRNSESNKEVYSCSGDKCLLTEFYCGPLNTIPSGIQVYNCPNGCINGACISAEFSSAISSEIPIVSCKGYQGNENYPFPAGRCEKAYDHDENTGFPMDRQSGVIAKFNFAKKYYVKEFQIKSGSYFLTPSLSFSDGTTLDISKVTTPSDGWYKIPLNNKYIEWVKVIWTGKSGSTKHKTGILEVKAIELKGYKKASWACYDGLKPAEGGIPICKSSAAWKEYAEIFCKNRCNADKTKCGLSHWKVEEICSLP